jgi:hypothetical protein
MSAEMRSVYSSHINEVGYDAASREFVVLFDSGKTYVYEDVPENTAHEVVNSPSVGSALNRLIKGVYKHKLLGE